MVPTTEAAYNGRRRRPHNSRQIDFEHQTDRRGVGPASLTVQLPADWAAKAAVAATSFVL